MAEFRLARVSEVHATVAVALIRELEASVCDKIWIRHWTWIAIGSWCKIVVLRDVLPDEESVLNTARCPIELVSEELWLRLR